MLQKIKLVYILISGFTLLGFLTLLTAFIGHNSTNQIKTTLDYIAGDAWDTADGAMEGTIGIELQMLSLEQYLDDINNNTAKKNLAEGLALEEEALSRMVNAKQISPDNVKLLNSAREDYHLTTKNLSTAFKLFTNLENTRKQKYESLLSTLDEVEELGDNFVQQYERAPDSPVSWNGGLAESWAVADGIMEYRINILSRGSNYQSLMHTKDFDKYLPIINKPWDEISAIIEELGLHTDTPIVPELSNLTISAGEFKGQSYANALRQATKEHKQTFDAAIEQLRVLDKAYIDYQHSSKSLLDMVGEVEEVADGKVESIIETIAEQYNQVINQLIWVALAAIVIAIVVSITLIRLILSQTNQAKNLAKTIASGDLSNKIVANQNTEFGQLMHELDQMQSALQSSQSEMKAHLAESKLIVDALDNASANIIIATPEKDISFANKNARELITANQTELQKQIPNLSVDHLTQKGMKFFESLSISLENPKQTVHINAHSLEIHIQPIMNNEKMIGYFTEWKDITHTMAIEAEVNELITKASKGSLDQRIDTSKMDGFLLNLSTGINTMMDNIQSALKSFISTAEELSKGNLNQPVNANFEGDLQSLKNSLNQATYNISHLISDALQTSSEVSSAANRILESSVQVSETTSANAASIEQTAASLEQMASSIKQSSDYTRQVNESSVSTIKQATENAEIVEKSVDAMHSIKEVSSKINGITNLIDSIAFQTNLLALNAAVEAARAGEHGRGFAVVAGEVRSLAQKSAEAAKEIQTLVAEVNSKVENGTQLVEASSESLTKIIEDIQNVGNMIEEITRSSNEQETGVGQVNQAVNTFDSSTQKTAAMMEDTSHTSSELTRMMSELESKLNQFQLLESEQSALIEVKS